MDPKYIAIEGPIGVGKSTLARRIAEIHDATLLLDPYQQNPFLERFYTKPGNFALATQLDFLLRRLELLGSLKETSDSVIVADFLLAKDRLFAELVLSKDEFWVYDRVHMLVVKERRAPDLVIYLQAPLETLLDRIQDRGVEFEQRIATAYLQRLIYAYSTFFHSYSDSPLLIVNAKDINFAENPRDFENLLQQIDKLDAGRHYLNPLPA